MTATGERAADQLPDARWSLAGDRGVAFEHVAAGRWRPIHGYAGVRGAEALDATQPAWLFGEGRP